MNRIAFSGFAVLLLSAFAGIAASPTPEPNAVVAADGSGQYKTVLEAINAAPQLTTTGSPTWVIFVKPGTYKELIYVQREKRFIRLVGADPKSTIITFDLNANIKGPDGVKIGTFRTPTVYIDADDFTVENITLENSAGQVGQALALRVDGDRVAFRNCRFLGWQDTILVNRGRHYFEGCFITGGVDFIFGAATTWFENCDIVCRSGGYVTAASTPDKQPFGFVFSNCRISGEKPDVKSLLGRPWRAFASTIFLNTEMSEVIQPPGWNDWGKPERQKTVRYAEYKSTGPGGDPKDRVPWSAQLTEAEAKEITADRVLGGDDMWKPSQQLKVSTPQEPFVPKGAEFKPDIEYGRVVGEKLWLDACIPEGTGPFPVAIMVHGGGWCSGDKAKDHGPVLEALTKAKFTWFSINYRLAPMNRWPACFEDVLTAIRWVKAHAAEFKGDPNRIVLMGYSAGGQLACQAAVLAGPDTQVQAVVGFAAPTDLLADIERRGGMSASMQALLDRPLAIDDASRVLLKELSPITHIKSGLPPFLLVQGTEDKTVLPSQSTNFQAKLKEAGVDCELISVEGAPHRLVDWDKIDPSYREKLTDWLGRVLDSKKSDTGQ